MRRISYRSYVFLFFFLLSAMSLPKSTSERMRCMVVCSFAPGWRSVNFLKEKTLLLLTLPFSKEVSASSNHLEIERLSQENQILRSQIENVRQWLLCDDRIQEQIKRYQGLLSTNLSEEFFKRRSQELCNALDLQTCSLPAKVVFREPASWSSTLWINLGENDNAKLGKKIICNNSPVLLGTSIVGIVEYVGSAQSRVRLITDARLSPSVRAIRGNEQNRYLLEHFDALIFSLEKRQDLFSSEDESKVFAQTLHRLKMLLKAQVGDFYLAKGELRGTSNPLWRSRAQVLKGVGFNYDFPDAEGPARDLRTGELYAALHKEEAVPLLLPGDLLVTTGFDGVFPPGFRVAIVSSVQTLKEGASSYEIEAISTAGNLDELTHVFVLPPSLFQLK